MEEGCKGNRRGVTESFQILAAGLRVEVFVSPVLALPRAIELSPPFLFEMSPKARRRIEAAGVFVMLPLLFEGLRTFTLAEGF